MNNILWKKIFFVKSKNVLCKVIKLKVILFCTKLGMSCVWTSPPTSAKKCAIIVFILLPRGSCLPLWLGSSQRIKRQVGGQVLVMTLAACPHPPPLNVSPWRTSALETPSQRETSKNYSSIYSVWTYE